MSKLTDNIEKARATSREKIDGARELASDGVGIAYERISESKARAAALLGESREKAQEKLSATKEKISSGRDVAKEAAQKAALKSEEAIERNPLAIIAGGAALGIIIGALLPRSQAEKKYIGAVGHKINDAAHIAFEAAKDASREQISEMGLNNDRIREQFKDLFGKVIAAAKGAIIAAQDAAESQNQDRK